jgi:iron complex transport system substrate-binding protein
VRICSLLPSATEIVCDLGLASSLVGVSAECRWPPEVVGTPVVTAARIDPAQLSSAEIDRRVRASLRNGGSLYAVDAGLLDELRPDVIVTQDLCAVCAVSSDGLAGACPAGVEVISLDPRTLEEVARSVETLAERLGVPDRGREVANDMRRRIAVAASAVAGRERRRLFVAEWLDPPFCAGHWLPEMVELAGGREVLGQAGRPSFAVTWERVLAASPELVVAAPCGFDAPEAARRAAALELPCPVVAVDGDAYYSRPAPRLALGVEQLAHLLHPSAVADAALPAFERAPAAV